MRFFVQFQLGVLLLVAQAAWLVRGSYDDEVNLSSPEKAALDKFKSVVIPKIPEHSYIQNYKNDDLYWIKWVRSKSLNVPVAVEAFLKHLKWRETERMDTIDDEDWSEFQKDFPVFLDTFDKEGRPAVEVWFSDWNARSAVLTGKSKTLQRWLTRIPEILTRRLYKARATGTPVAFAMAIFDVEGFNFIQHACPSCIVVYTNFLVSYENHYPNLQRASYMVNVPPAFSVFVQTIKPLMSGPSVKALKSYSDRAEWMKVLDNEFKKDQRSVRFGGTRTREVEA